MDVKAPSVKMIVDYGEGDGLFQITVDRAARIEAADNVITVEGKFTTNRYYGQPYELLVEALQVLQGIFTTVWVEFFGDMTGAFKILDIEGNDRAIPTMIFDGRYEMEQICHAIIKERRDQ